MSVRSRGHVLVVDDDQDIRDSLLEALIDEGYAAAGAGNGVEALAYLDSGAAKPNLIILDLMMPLMDGIQFREAQLQNERHAAIPVAVVTANDAVEHKAKQLRAAGWMRKPHRIRPFLELVDRIIRGGEGSGT